MVVCVAWWIDVQSEGFVFFIHFYTSNSLSEYIMNLSKRRIENFTIIVIDGIDINFKVKPMLFIGALCTFAELYLLL